jgi:hypothetical protein
MKRLGKQTGETLSVTAQRLVVWGMTEGQAYVLAKLITLKHNAKDAVVEEAVINALVSVKASGEVSDIEYISGCRCDVQRHLEGGQR